ncbi:LysR family transcriptional regulator [Nocardia sp. NBC_00881]|uniref:LysR family transcriptional regulator n=1 Tax=Nocardia sp. NBC_00881 TaxID=2975995 RepID=UPI00386AAB97|nr:LysR family transcriptional regulator [Nocardia sp. NBC_00881]
MQLRDIEVFLVLAEELHFRRAAGRLYLSTGRVSQTVRSLEKELGGSLFARTSREVHLTPLGEQFRTDAGHSLELLRAAVARAHALAASHKQVLRVGYLASVGAPLVAELATECQARHPGIQVATTAEFTSTGFDILRNRVVDVLLTWSPGGDADAVAGEGRVAGPVLASVERAVLVPSDHSLTAGSAISIEQVAGYEVLDVSADAPPAFAAAWTPPHTPMGQLLRRAETDLPFLLGREPVTILDVMTMVERYRLPYLTVGSLLSYHPYPGLTLVPVSDLPPCVLLPVWHTEFETRAVRAFADVVAQHSSVTAAGAIHFPANRRIA